jgi:serine/threonine protein kinase
MIGQTLNNRYEVTTRLGKGAMGTVYRAIDTQSERDVAVKVISSELAVDPAMLERFKREGEALRQLRHVNIVGFIDAFQYGELSIIVMEFVSGGSLYDLIKKGPLPIESAVQIALDLCDALIRAHRLKIIHRDIKPENILIDEDGTPKLADFGVARLSEGTRMTRSGVQVGTPYYMSPEAWEGRTLDAQADIWSLGVVLFEMLTAQVPFGGDTPLAVMSRINTTPPPDLKKLRSDVPSSLAKIISRMLTRNKQRRYQTMREVAVELEREQESLRREKRPAPNLIFQQLAASILQQMQTFKAKLSRFFSGSKSVLRKVHPYMWVAGGISVVLAITLVIFLYLRPTLPTFLPPGTASIVDPVVFSGTSSNESIFYLYDPANNPLPLTISVGPGTNSEPVRGSSGNIYFTSDRGGKAEIYRRLTDGKIEQVTDTPDPFESWGPVLGTSGNIYFTSNQGDGKAEIYRLINGGDKQAQRMTDTPDPFESWGPVLGVTGNLYFTSNRDGKAEIYRVINGGNRHAQRVTRTPGRFESWGPALGISGNIYFTSNRDGKAEIYRLINESDEHAKRVTHTPEPFESWGPTLLGQDIYFTSNRSGREEVYLLKQSDSISIFNLESRTTSLDERTSIH